MKLLFQVKKILSCDELVDKLNQKHHYATVGNTGTCLMWTLNVIMKGSRNFSVNVHQNSSCYTERQELKAYLDVMMTRWGWTCSRSRYDSRMKQSQFIYPLWLLCLRNLKHVFFWFLFYLVHGVIIIMNTEQFVDTDLRKDPNTL